MTTDRQTGEQEAAVAHLRDLLEAHFREAEEYADEDGKFSIGFGVTFDRSCDPTKLKMTCRIAKTITDEVESRVSGIEKVVPSTIFTRRPSQSWASSIRRSRLQDRCPRIIRKV